MTTWDFFSKRRKIENGRQWLLGNGADTYDSACRLFESLGITLLTHKEYDVIIGKDQTVHITLVKAVEAPINQPLLEKRAKKKTQ